jgi:hypothetical protein
MRVGRSASSLIRLATALTMAAAASACARQSSPEWVAVTSPEPSVSVVQQLQERAELGASLASPVATRPATSATPSAAPSRSPVAASHTPEAAGLTAKFSLSSTWDSGFVAVVVLTSTAAVPAWNVRLTFPAGVTIPDGLVWNAVKQGSTGTVTFTGGPLPAGQQVTFGFQAAKMVQNQKDFLPTACTVNGAHCEGF